MGARLGSICPRTKEDRYRGMVRPAPTPTTKAKESRLSQPKRRENRVSISTPRRVGNSITQGSCPPPPPSRSA